MQLATIPRAARWSILLAAFASSGCGDDPRADQVAAAELIVGTTASEWGLLAIPAAGGAPTLRLVVRPDSAVWTGASDVPVLLGAWPLGETEAVLLTSDSSVLRYDPAAGSLEEVAVLAGGGGYSSHSPAGAAFVDSAGRRLHLVAPDRAVALRLDEPAAWAGAMKAGIAVLVGPAPHELRLLQPAAPDSASGHSVPAVGRLPAHVTAWGDRLVLTAPDGRGIRLYSFEETWVLVGEVALGDSVTAITASPSSHEIYVGLASPPRVERVSRFSLNARHLAETSSTPAAMRPGLFGEALLVRSGAGIERVSISGEDVDLLAGDWRGDLPIGLPANGTLVVADDETRFVADPAGEGVLLDDGAPLWWVPVRWNPARARTPALAEALGAARPGSEEGEADAPGDGESATDDTRADVPTVESDEGNGEQPTGYYAIVTSARQRSGVDDLLRSLEEAGYPTRVQSYPDEAGETWHRGLVGPFPTRARAQAAARQLLRERDLQAWVTEIGVSR